MSGINRFLSRRDKHSHSKHGKEEPLPSSGPLNGLFVDDDTKRKSQSWEKDEENKIRAIAQRLTHVGITNFKDPDISYVLHTDFGNGDSEKAYESIRLLEDSEAGIIHPYNSNIKMQGAINRQGVTCYLDALLFAMFARLGSFEAMLYKNFEDAPRKRLATLLRFWVNCLRAGKLITVDITKQIQLQLAECGWKEAAKLCQQDASEAFTFITATLALPLLTLKMDIFHTGKEDASDDHKLINERLLELAIPEDNAKEEGHRITLEECLEMFFNNKIEVKRYLDDLQRRNTLSSINSRKSVSSAKGNASWVEVAEVEDGGASSPVVSNTTQTPMPASYASPTSGPRPAQRLRAPSIIKETYVNDEKRAMMDGTYEDKAGGFNHPRVRKEVIMPAWQFFSLIPWYTNNVPSNDAQVAAHFSSTRPILGISLKRYTFTSKGEAVKRDTHVDIPLEIGLPSFIQDDRIAEDGPAFGNFKLSLQSIICHQGKSVNSGHYISIVRSPDPKGQGSDEWIKFDDLATERVTPIDAEQFLKTSMEPTPYLLFYQVVPIEDDPGHFLASAMGGGVSGNDPEMPPPSYADSIVSHESKGDSGVSGLISSKNVNASNSSTDPSIISDANTRSFDDPSRPSFEEISSDEVRRGRSSAERRPPSAVFVDANNQSGPPINLDPVDGQSSAPVRRPLTDGPNTLTAGRRGSNVSNTKYGSKSRPVSTSGENRLSRSLSRFAERMTRDKQPNDTVAMTAPPSIQTEEKTPNMLLSPMPMNTSLPILHSEEQHGQATAPGGGPSLTLVGEAEKLREKAKLKKEMKEAKETGKSKSRSGHAHTHLSKADKRTGKPERECMIM